MAKRAARQAEPVIEMTQGLVSNPDVEIVKVDGAAIGRWVQNAEVFFTEAKALERAAATALETANALKMPTSKVEAEQLQDIIRSWNASRKHIEGYWTITSLLSKLHKAAVAYRDRGVKLYVQAAAIGNGLHNRYVETERRKVEEENRRREAEAEERQRQERDAELARLEEQALRAEAASEDLSEREQRFVARFVEGAMRPEICARMAGYKDPQTIAARLMAMPKIQRAIEAGRTAAALRRQAEAVKHEPLVVDVEPKAADVPDGGSRTTWSGEILDEAACREAAFAGTHGIPHDLFVISPTKLNQYAKDMKLQMNRWPGVRAKSTTRVV